MLPYVLWVGAAVLLLVELARSLGETHTAMAVIQAQRSPVDIGQSAAALGIIGVALLVWMGQNRRLRKSMVLRRNGSAAGDGRNVL